MAFNLFFGEFRGTNGDRSHEMFRKLLPKNLKLKTGHDKINGRIHSQINNCLKDKLRKCSTEAQEGMSQQEEIRGLMAPLRMVLLVS